MNDYAYPGSELELFAQARNWKRYFAARLRPWIQGEVLEVGAGLGETTKALRAAGPSTWLCLEPDPGLAEGLRARVRSLAGPVEVAVGTLDALDPARRFDCILYIDVLEHVADDKAEVALAASRLTPGGVLLVLAPAHQRFYTPFDQAIGHYRRYDRPMMRALRPPGVELQRLEYLDAVGLLCSCVNRLFLKTERPTLGNILFWDRVLIPLSRVLDPLLGRRIGRSLVAIWRRDHDLAPAVGVSGVGAGAQAEGPA